MFLSDLTTDQLMLLVIPALPNMWGLKHAMYHDFPTSREKYRWMMACVFLPCVGGIAYFFIGRKHAGREKIDIFAKKEKNDNAPVVSEDDADAPSEPGKTAVFSETGEDAAGTGAAGSLADENDKWSFGCPKDDSKGSSEGQHGQVLP